MERRRSRRIIVSLKAEIISGSLRYAGMIDNLSEHGMYVRTLPAATSIDVTPGTIFDIELQSIPGTILYLHCRLLWSYKTPPHGLTYSLGMEIINPPPEYKTFVDSLK